MGLLVDGQWRTDWHNSKETHGKFERKAAAFRNWITADGSAGPSGRGGFKAEPDRYHLYVSLACPWAHRTLIYRQLKGLQQMISVSVVNSLMAENGWTFQPGEGVIEDSVNGVEFIHQLYTLADPAYSGRATVPVLWDKQQQTIVSNESAEIIRMFNQAFDHCGATPLDLAPAELLAQIDELNAFIYHHVNNGVYRAGFATTQQAYQQAVTDVFVGLDQLEQRLSGQRYLLGEQITEADWRLFTTLIRFDAVYVGHFKCNLRRIADYPNLSQYLRDLYQQPKIAETVNIPHIKHHYYASHSGINPTGIVPQGPDLDLMAAHQRQLKFSQLMIERSPVHLVWLKVAC